MRIVPSMFLIVLAQQLPSLADGFICAGMTDARPAIPQPTVAAKAIQSAQIETRNAVLIFATFKGEAPADGQVPAWAHDIFDPDRPGSFTHFYNEMSLGRHQVHGEVVPRWYESDHDRAFYLSDSRTERGRYGEFSLEILGKADADIDFPRFDNDGPDGVPDSGDDDGVADVVFIALTSAPANFLLGPATGIGILWRTADEFGPGNQFETNDTGAAGTPVAISSTKGTLQAGASYAVLVGSMAHEYGHVLGLPDLFNTEFLRSEEPLGPEDDSAGIGAWGLMGWGALGWNGDDGPNSFSAWSRMRLGWAQMSDQSQAMQTVHMQPVATTAAVHRVPVRQNEFFLLEHRTRHSYYDRNIPAEGLLIWHIDSGSGEVDLECADGRWLDAGFPLGKVPDPHGGEDNLDFWAHDATYRDARGGNLGDATDPFDGESYVAFTPHTNPASFDADGRSFEISDIHVDEAQLVVQVEIAPMILSARDVRLVDESGDGIVMAGEPVTVRFSLRNDGGIPAKGIKVVVSSRDPLVEIIRGETPVIDLEIGQGAVIRPADSSAPVVRLRDAFAGTHTASVSLEIYLGEELVEIEEVMLTGVSPGLSIREVGIVDSVSNGDGRAQIGEIIRLDLGLDVQAPDALTALTFDLRSLHPDVVALGSVRGRVEVSATAARILSSEFIIQSGAEAGDMLGFELAIDTGGVATRKDTVYVEVAEGRDETAPRVARLIIKRAGDGLLLSLYRTDIVEGSEIRSVAAVVYAYRDTTELASIPLRWTESRFEGIWSDIPDGPYLFRSEVEDEFGNEGVGDFQAFNLALVSGPVPESTGSWPLPPPHNTGPWRFVGPPGDHWVSANTGIAFAPSAPGVIYATTRTALWRSVDGGDSWHPMGVMLQRSMDDIFYLADWSPLRLQGVLVDAIDPRIVYLTVHPLRSRDGGLTWESISVPGSGVDVALLAADPGRGSRLYARRDQRLWISDDAGDSWRDSGLREQWQAVLVHPSEPHWIYAVVDDGRVFGSADGGVNWTEGGKPPRRPRIEADPRCPDCLLATAGGELWVSSDNASSWQPTGTAVRVRVTRWPFLLYDHDSYYYFRRSSDGGRTWEQSDRWSEEPDYYGHIWSIVIDPFDPEHILAVMEGEGYSGYPAGWTLSIPQSRDAFRTWSHPTLDEPSGEPVSTILFDADGRLYAGGLANAYPSSSGEGAAIYVSSDAGATWEWRSTVAPERQHPPPDVSFTSLTLDPFNRDRLLGLTQGKLLVSEDGGQGWISRASASPTIIADPTQRGMFYSARPGTIMRSDDGGISWEWQPLPEEGVVNGIAIDPQDGGWLYAAVGNRIYRSADQGLNWVLAGVVGDGDLLTLEAQPGTRRLWAATPEGVYSSVDNGKDWELMHEAGQQWVFTEMVEDRAERIPNPVRIRFDPHDSDRFFLVTPRQLLETRDGGKSWHSIGKQLAGYPWFNDVAVSPVDPDALFVATSWGVYRLDGRETAVAQEPVAVPREFKLEQNHPNPFNSNTTIRFSVPARGDVELSIYNLAGQKTRVLLSTILAQGIHPSL